MKEINSKPIPSEIHQDNGTENRGYVRSQSDHHLPTFTQNERINIKDLPRTTSAEASIFPVIYEVPTDIPFISPTPFIPSSAPATVYNHHSQRRSTAAESPERQLSLLDPMSDRVSTILVWQHLTVSTREDKQKEILQHIKSSKNFVPKRKCLLHNVSGAITGGLWAVMGKFSILQRIYLMNVLYK
jgi:hypothetical protein